MGWTKGRGVHVGCSGGGGGGGIIGAANLLAPPLITTLSREERVVGHQLALASHLLVRLFGGGLPSNGSRNCAREILRALPLCGKWTVNANREDTSERT